MKKLLIAAIASLGVLVSGCGPSNQAPVYQDDGYAQVQQRPLDGHGDAILAGIAGVAAGKMLSDRSHRNRGYNRPYSRPYYAPSYSRPTYRTTYSVRPSYSTSRSSSYGSYRSRRR